MAAYFLVNTTIFSGPNYTTSRDVTPRLAQSARWEMHKPGRIATCALASASTYLILSLTSLPVRGAALLILALCVLIPSHPDLCARVAVNLSSLMGWAPVLWWTTVPLNHGAATLAVGVGVLAWFASGPRDARPVLIPTPRFLDGLLVVAAAVAVWALEQYWAVRTPTQALVVLLPGWDNYAHVYMFTTMRLAGHAMSAVGASPEGSSWGYESYPQGAHALLASLSELAGRSAVPDGTLLVDYVTGVAAVVLLATVALCAGLLALLPGSRGVLAIPLVALVLAAFLGVPGQQALAGGFFNFWLASVAAALLVLLTVRVRDARPVGMAIAAGGLVNLVALAWPPLLLLVAPAVGMLALQIFPRRTPGWRWVSILPLAGSAAVVLFVVHQLITSLRLAEVANAPGPTPVISPERVLLLASAAALVGLLVPSSWMRGAVASPRLLGVTALWGVSAVGAILVFQLVTAGAPSYYFFKTALGLEMLLSAVLAAALGLATSAARSPVAVRRGWTWALAFAVVLVVVFGFGSLRIQPLHSPDGTAMVAPPYDRHAIATGILSAVHTDVGQGRSSFDSIYVATGSARTAQLGYADAWFHAIGQSLSMRVMLRSNRMAVPPRSAEWRELGAVLEADHRVRVLSSREGLAEIHRNLAPALRHNRILLIRPR